MPTAVSSNYSIHNSEQSKQVVILVKIDGVDMYFTNRAPTTLASYGDPIAYGDVGLVYGGYRYLVENAEFMSILSMQGSSLTISQKLEPEQGRASVTNLSLAFIDYQSYMTRLCSPGVIVDDILGRAVEVYLGYLGTDYPTDFMKVFRGYVSSYSSQCGLYTLQLSDPNMKRRQELFVSKTTKLNGAINAAVTTIPLVSTSGFYSTITGPSGGTDTATNFYIKVEDEFIQYASASGNSLIGCTRGARNTVAASHADQSDVALYAQLTDHAMDMALKLMLSGWGGAFESGVSVLSLGGTSAAYITFPVGVDLKRDYGLTDGDWITISGSATPANNASWQIVSFLDLDGQSNRIARISGSLTTDTSTAILAAFRSQYDTYPTAMGLKLKPIDVDVDQHKFMKRTWIPGSEYSYQFLIEGAESSGKSFIEREIYLPFGLYSLTKRGQLSVGITKPPIGDQVLPILDQDNIVDGANIRVTRAVNNRKFFNQITYEYDLSDSGVFASVFSNLDTDSLNQVGLKSTLPIQSKGAKTSLGTNAVLSRQADYLLSRYKTGAVQITLSVNWGVGNQIEAGDVIALRDDGTLQIANWSTGQRDMGFTLFEVEDRRLDMAQGRVNLTLISNIGAQASDRFGFISPSSLIASASASGSTITIIDSYGAVYPGDEPRKWRDYVGQQVLVHSSDWTVTGIATLSAIDSTNPYVFTLNPALTFTPASGYVLDIPYYSSSPDPAQDVLYKSAYCHFDPQVPVVSGASTGSFTVSSANASKFFVGCTIRVHTASYSQDSGDVVVSGVSGTTITTSTSLGFVPSSACFCDLIGFSADGGAAYRIIV